jgi:transcriptional regulator GlxA family with amidase domain
VSATTSPRRCVVGLVLFDDVELLDHAGPYEVFTTATRMAARRTGAEGTHPGFEVLSLARDETPVRARAGQGLLPDASFANAPPLDLLLVPGGEVSGALHDERLLAFLAARAPQVPMLASVCTGVFLLARAGLLAPGTAVTTHWEDLDDLRQAAPTLDVRDGVRWVRHEREPGGGRPVYSSAGISAGIDLALHLVEVIAGRALAERTARQMDVRWIDEACSTA